MKIIANQGFENEIERIRKEIASLEAARDALLTVMSSAPREVPVIGGPYDGDTYERKDAGRYLRMVYLPRKDPRLGGFEEYQPIFSEGDTLCALDDTLVALEWAHAHREVRA